MGNYYKRIGLLRKKAGFTQEQFIEYWTTVHAGMAKRLPKLRRYVINVVADRKKYPHLGADGFSELWFDSIADHDAAFASPLGVELLADVQNFAEGVNAVMVEEHRMIWS